MKLGVHAAAVLLLATSVAGAADEKAARLERFLAEAAGAAVAGDRQRAEFFIVRYVGEAMAAGRPIDGASLLELGGRLDVRPTPFLSSPVHEAFVDWFVASTYLPWNVPDGGANEEMLAMVIAAESDDRHFIQVVGSPTLRSFVMPGESTTSMLHLVDGSRPIYLTSGTVRERTPEHFFPNVAIDTHGSDVHSFHRPRFVDFDRDGRSEIAVRYTLLTNDTFSQVLEIHRPGAGRLERVSAFASGAGGFTQLTPEGDVLVGRPVASRPEAEPGRLDRTEIERIRLVDDSWQVVERFEQPNVLHSDAFTTYFVERSHP